MAGSPSPVRRRRRSHRPCARRLELLRPRLQDLKAGGKVKFKWEGGGFDVHDVNVEKGPTKFRSPLQAGGTFTSKKLKAGKYVLFCSQHPEEMRMSFKVKK